MRTAALPQISSFFTTPPHPPTANSIYSLARGRGSKAILFLRADVSGAGLRPWRPVLEAWKSGRESSPRISNAGSATAKVYFCISEHTNAGACSNSLSRAAHDNSPAAALFDLQCFP